MPAPASLHRAGGSRRRALKGRPLLEGREGPWGAVTGSVCLFRVCECCPSTEKNLCEQRGRRRCLHEEKGYRRTFICASATS